MSPKRFEPLLWLQTKGLPAFQKQSSALINRFTADPSRQHWTALEPSNNWSRRILWTLVGLAGFGIVWASFARIDETVQATGKLEPKGATKEVKAPLGGVISEILVKDGELVEKGQTLLIIEAMKVMNPITAPADGTVKQIFVQNAQPVEFGEVLVVIE